MCKTILEVRWSQLYDRYGEKGNDKLLMAPWQEVYEYIWLRDHTKIDLRQIGKNVTIRIHILDLPESFRHKEISLNVQSKSAFLVDYQKMNMSISDNGS